MRLSHRAAVVTAVALTGLATATPALAAGTAGNVGVSLGGTNVSANVKASTTLPFAAAGTVASVSGAAVTVKGLNATTAYPVADKALVTLDGRTVALSALPVGARVAVVGTVTNGTTYSAKLLTALSRWPLNLSGTVSAVDAAKGTVTVNNGTAAVKLNVDPKVNLQVNGAKVSLANLPVGAAVTLSGTETPVGATVNGIEAKVSRARA